MTTPVRYVFVSSTVRDLQAERAASKAYLENSDGPVKISCLLSEAPDFPVGADSLGNKDTYDICLANVSRSDVLIQLIGQRYGIPDIDSDGELVSIIHQEYRVAFRKRIPVFSFVHERTRQACTELQMGNAQSHIPTDQVALCNLLHEISGHRRKKWLFFWSTVDDVITALRTNLLGFDNSSFVNDVTIPDGTIIRTNQRFEKIWEIRNFGMVTWQDRYLVEDNPGVAGVIPEKSRIPIPDTAPGEAVRLSVWFRAPEHAGSCISNWKMVDADGRHYFPWKIGIWVAVKVID